jgi:hypothetical protein
LVASIVALQSSIVNTFEMIIGKKHAVESIPLINCVELVAKMLIRLRDSALGFCDAITISVPMSQGIDAGLQTLSARFVFFP